MANHYVPGASNPYFPKHKYIGVKLGGNMYPLSQAKVAYHVDSAARAKKAIETEMLTAEHLWMTFQQEAEGVVLKAGQPISDVKERNRRINAAYAKLWLADNRFQWAGLAAFASKQVGCGLLHAGGLGKKQRDELQYSALSAGNSSDAGDIRDSVESLAQHEQVNVLQAIMYNDERMQRALAANQFSFATKFPSGIFNEIQLTLSAQCRVKPALTSVFTAAFSGEWDAKLWVVKERMEFVKRAASKFDQLLSGPHRRHVEESILAISAGGGVN